MKDKESPFDKFHNCPKMRALVVRSKKDSQLNRALNEAIDEARQELAESFAIGDITQMEALRLIEEREGDFIEYARGDIEEADNIPEWLLRKQAQHMLAKHLLEEIEDLKEDSEQWD